MRVFTVFKIALEQKWALSEQNSDRNRKSLLDMDKVRFSLALCVFAFRRYRLRLLILR